MNLEITDADVKTLKKLLVHMMHTNNYGLDFQLNLTASDGIEVEALSVKFDINLLAISTKEFADDKLLKEQNEETESFEVFEAIEASWAACSRFLNTDNQENKGSANKC